MAIIHTYQKSKKRKPNAQQRELAADWEKIVAKHQPRTTVKPKTKPSKIPKLVIPSDRNARNYPSLNSFVPDGGCTKPIEVKVYTGTKMMGIGTLHKSNAVPIFTDEEARDQAAMRR